MKEPKQKKCKSKGCGVLFAPTRPMQTVCSVMCAVLDARIKREQAETKKRQEQRRKDRETRDKLKTRADWLKEAQAAFNAYIRARDADQPCISCGRHHTGQWHAGHYLSRGARPELAMHPDNCHKQCAPCNTHLSGNLVLYRVNLINKIGLDRVEWLEGPHEPLKLTVPDIKAIRDKYRALAKQLEKETA
ncbi:recombination protein NinG [uncultured Aquabacterium sp.]|uniref:recombination protein NinG n=1 Tax=uncultured Aquabacterium sp. TaxID=158753 RepID=UPI0025F4BB0E|nr:recombination protein NinG [uncultured Aquabacterium sp.]